VIGDTDALGLSSEEIVAKVIDGEAIIINLSNGYYYSTVHTGAVVWAGVEAGQTPEAIITAVTAQFAQDRSVVKRDVDAFLAELASEGLIAVTKSSAVPAQSSSESAPVGTSAYQAPTLTKFEDMAHFFALDPPLPDLDECSSSGVEP
jgi:hypothetical protein